MSNPSDPPKTLEQILSQYAVSIVERSDSSGLDKRETLTEIQALALHEALEIISEVCTNQPITTERLLSKFKDHYKGE